MYKRICADGSAGPPFISSDGAGGNPLISLDGAGSFPRYSYVATNDVGDILDE